MPRFILIYVGCFFVFVVVVVVVVVSNGHVLIGLTLSRRRCIGTLHGQSDDKRVDAVDVLIL